MITLTGAEGIAYVQRMMLKEAAYIKHAANTLPNSKEALRKPGLEFADNIEYFACCLTALKNGETIEFRPPHIKHMETDDYRDN